MKPFINRHLNIRKFLIFSQLWNRYNFAFIAFVISVDTSSNFSILLVSLRKKCKKKGKKMKDETKFKSTVNTLFQPAPLFQ